MDSRDLDTVECAFKKRLLRDVPLAAPGRLEAFAAFVKGFCEKHIPKVNVPSFEEWLEACPYSTARKEELRVAHDGLRGGPPTRKQCSKVDTFVKTEFYTEWKHARMINSRCDAFKVWSGPRFSAIEKVVYELPEFIKHTPVPERPNKIKGLKQAGRRYYQTDFTAFESHFTPDVMNACECVLYRHCLGTDKHADYLCEALTGMNRMRTRTGVTATVRGRRMSGDMCTSLGNGFTNLMLAKFLVHEKGGYLEGFVEGDDGLFCTDVELTTKDYADLGFTIKIDEVPDPCHASFCGMIFSDSGQIIKDPRKVFMGFGWTSSFIHAGPRIMGELLRAKALSAVYETPHCPVVGALARYALTQTRGSNPRYTDTYKHCPLKDERGVAAFSPTWDTRQLFADKYGVSIPAQLAAEAAILRGDFESLAVLIPPTDVQCVYTEVYVEPT